MAPALTEPLSPTENLTNSAVTAASTPTTRSTRKLESSIVKFAQLSREKRSHNAGTKVNQTDSSSKRITRSRDNQRSLLTPTPLNEENTSKEKQSITRKIFKVASVQGVDTTISNSIINNNISSAKNAQMGLSTAPLINENSILNNKNNNTSQNLNTIENSTKDTSTAQLLADLTNEALTAEICLRNQLKDVNLVKTTGDPSSPIIQQETFIDTDTDIVVTKVESPEIAEKPEPNKATIAHMEAQFINSSQSSKVQETTSNASEETTTSKATITKEEKIVSNKDSTNYKEKDILEKEAKGKETASPHKNQELKEYKCKAETCTKTVKNDGATAIHDIQVGSPNPSEDAAEPKKTSSKFEILSVQELPPVNTDSTMTASEVEDNLEERLSQLDGTAIESPPPNNHDMDSNDKTIQNSVAVTTPPCTPTQQTLSNDLQDLQEQLQHTPPTPAPQQVLTNNQQLELQQQPSITNCYTTPPSATSSINNLNAVGNMQQTFLKETDGVVGGATELEDQDIEEVFKVLKGFEGGTTSDLNVCDLNVLFNEVYMKINETEMSSSNATIGAGITNTSISSNSHSHVTVANPSIQLVKPTEMEEGQLEIKKRQQQMQRKIDFLTRRLRKLQARYMCKHASEEIAGLFEWTARQASKGVTNTTALQHSEALGAQDPNRCFLKVIAARPPASDWKDVHESLVPANQISTLLRKIESVANAQQLCTTPTTSLINITHKKTKKALLEAKVVAAASNSSAKSSSSFSEGKAEEVVVATLEENIADELLQIAGLLQTEMCEVQKAIDSDATESSSGGESADEMVTYNNTQQQSLPIIKRAAWRYSRDRAAIASRWSWLLSQISDLEIKIRQHSELQLEIVRSKGLITCDDQIENNTAEEQNNEDSMGSCRTRGFIPSLFRKRKLIQTTNIHTISKKAARPSTIKCGCQWPIHPCALCTGRLDPTAPRDLPDTMMMSDRMSLLDSGYHPVLSFRENVNNALHFEAIAKQPEWQQRVMRCQAKNIAKNIWRAEREAVAASGSPHSLSTSKKYGDGPPAKRRYIKKKDRLNDEKFGGKSSHTTSATHPSHAAVPSSTSTTEAQPIATVSISATTFNDVGNGTSTLSTTISSTTPLVANKGITKNAKKQNSVVVKEEILKEPINSLLPPTRLSNNTSTIIPNNKFIHQTSDCLPTSYDQCNPNQSPSPLMYSNHNNSSKSNKHRKFSSSTVVNSHNYSHLNNSSSSLYNGDSSYIFSHENWTGTGENFSVRSRTSSPTHGSSGSNYHKYERSLDRKNRTSYDIDNIVIPYSVAAATRVEILPYKEIPTPKWRVIENEIEDIDKLKISKNQESDNEDTSATNCKPITNGHISDNNKQLDSIKDESASNEEKFDSTYSSVIVQVKQGAQEQIIESKESNKVNASTFKTLNDDTKKNALFTSCANYWEKNNNMAGEIKDKDKQPQNSSSSDDVKNINDADDELKLKKPKIEPSVIDNIRENKVAGDMETKSEKENENCSKSSIEEDEDISDDAMFLRHERALTEERRKFQTFLKFPWSTRSRANRRIDSRAESSGTNTPDPSSPAPQTPSVGGGDLESIPSPLNPATPLNPLDTISEAGDNSTSFLGVGPLSNVSSKRYERRRTTSSKRDREIERRSSTPDSKELIPPYVPITFPLSDEQFEELLRAMPIDHGEESKRFDDCYLPGGGNSGMGGILSNRCPRTFSGTTSKRTSRASTMCGDTTTTASGGRRIKSSNSKYLRPISADDTNISHENDDILLFDDEYEDDYPKHHLAPNDDHLTADSVGVDHVTASDGLYDDDDIYGDQYGAYVGRSQRKNRDSEGETSEEEPFQDDDPNDPEWRGETEERFRKKV